MGRILHDVYFCKLDRPFLIQNGDVIVLAFRKDLEPGGDDPVENLNHSGYPDISGGRPPAPTNAAPRFHTLSERGSGQVAYEGGPTRNPAGQDEGSVSRHLSTTGALYSQAMSIAPCWLILANALVVLRHSCPAVASVLRDYVWQLSRLASVDKWLHGFMQHALPQSNPDVTPILPSCYSVPTQTREGETNNTQGLIGRQCERETPFVSRFEPTPEGSVSLFGARHRHIPIKLGQHVLHAAARIRRGSQPPCHYDSRGTGRPCLSLLFLHQSARKSGLPSPLRLSRLLSTIALGALCFGCLHIFLGSWVLLMYGALARRPPHPGLTILCLFCFLQFSTGACAVHLRGQITAAPDKESLKPRVVPDIIEGYPINVERPRPLPTPCRNRASGAVWSPSFLRDVCGETETLLWQSLKQQQGYPFYCAALLLETLLEHEVEHPRLDTRQLPTREGTNDGVLCLQLNELIPGSEATPDTLLFGHCS